MCRTASAAAIAPLPKTGFTSPSSPSLSPLLFFFLQLFSTLTLRNTPSPSAPRAEAAQLRPFPCLAFPSSSSSLRETAPDLILIRLRRCWSVILRERICTDIVFSAFSWPQARLSGLSATHCVAVTCGKRQPEPASQLLVATWKSSVHFLPSVCVCIINIVSLRELSIMYLNTCPSVNDVLRSVRAPGSARRRGGTGVTAVPSPPRCGMGMGDRTEGWGQDLVAVSCSGVSQPAGTLVKWACGERRGAVGRMGPAGTGMALSDPCHWPGGAGGHRCPTLWTLMLAATSSQRNGTRHCTPEGLQEASGQQGRCRIDQHRMARVGWTAWHRTDGHSTAQGLELDFAGHRCVP